MKAKKPAPAAGTSLVKGAPAAPNETSFAEVVNLIAQARKRAYQAVNTELVSLYWKVGGYINRKLETAEWGDGVVDQLAMHLARTIPSLRGFTRSNLFRMRQFHKIYAGDKKVPPLVAQLPWTLHLILMGQCKRPEDREFYLRLAIRERWGKRELERQLRAALFERAVLSPPKVARWCDKFIRRQPTFSRTLMSSSFWTSLLTTPRQTCIAAWFTGLRIFSSSSAGTFVLSVPSTPCRSADGTSRSTFYSSTVGSTVWSPSS